MTVWFVVAVLTGGLAAALMVGGPAPRIARIAERAPSSLVARWGILGPVDGAPPVRRRVLMTLPAAAAAAYALGSLGRLGPWPTLTLGVVLAVVGVVGLGRLPSSESRRATATLQADLPQAWELLAAGLAAGLPLRAALAEVVEVIDGQLAGLLGEVLTRIRLGDSDDVAWRSIADHPLLGQPSRDLARSVASGTSVVELLEQYAVQAREDRHAAAEAAAKAIGVRAVLPLMICFLPAFFLIGIVPIIAGALLPLISGW